MLSLLTFHPTRPNGGRTRSARINIRLFDNMQRRGRGSEVLLRSPGTGDRAYADLGSAEEQVRTPGFEGCASGSVAPLVAVVDDTDAGERDGLGGRRRPLLDGSRLRGILLQGQVAAVLVVVGDAVCDQPAGVGLVEDHDPVEEFRPEAADPALSDPVLPRGPERDPDRMEAGCRQPVRDRLPEVGVAVVEDVAGRGCLRFSAATCCRRARFSRTRCTRSVRRVLDVMSNGVPAR